MRSIVSILIYIVAVYFGAQFGHSHQSWRWYAAGASLIFYLMASAGKKTLAEEKGPVPFYAHLLIGLVELLDGLALGILLGSFR